MSDPSISASHLPASDRSGESRATDIQTQKQNAFKNHALDILTQAASTHSSSHTSTHDAQAFNKDQAIQQLEALAESSGDQDIRHRLQDLMHRVQDASKHELSHLEHLHRLLEQSFRQQEGAEIKRGYESGLLVSMSQKAQNPFRSENPFAPKVPQVPKTKESKPTDNHTPHHPTDPEKPLTKPSISTSKENTYY